MSELVMAVARAEIEETTPYQGYVLDCRELLSALPFPSARFLHRAEAEQDTRFKQLIPYVVLRYRHQVFSYVRGKKSSESRLIAMRSIGVGGHIEPGDQSLFTSARDMYLDAARREVFEEVEIGSPFQEHIIALINDDSTEVGKVHLGIMHIWDLAEPKVTKREGLITKAGFLSIDELKKRHKELETWSQIALQVLQDLRTPPYSFASHSTADAIASPTRKLGRDDNNGGARVQANHPDLEGTVG